jgi:hypothetical protein
VVDTPGIRQFALWDIIPEELEGFFVDFRPFVPHCHYPGCTHTHEARCAIKEAVADHLIPILRGAELRVKQASGGREPAVSPTNSGLTPAAPPRSPCAFGEHSPQTTCLPGGTAIQ